MAVELPAASRRIRATRGEVSWHAVPHLLRNPVEVSVRFFSKVPHDTSADKNIVLTALASVYVQLGHTPTRSREVPLAG